MESAPSTAATLRERLVLLVPLALVIALVGYKTLGAAARLRSGIPPTLHECDALARTLLYLKAIWPALTFGVLIAASLRALVPQALLVRLFGGGARSQIVAGMAATPLMLCSCCAAPLFTGLYE